MFHRLSLMTVALFFVLSMHDLSAQSAASPTLAQPNVIVSVRDQKLMVVASGGRAATYPVSTSKFGLGDNWGSMATPTGLLQVAQKIGDHAPTGAVFHNRIIWLRSLQAENAHAFNRCIYIHGTPEEKLIGKPASYGCIRMKSSDIASLYAQLPLGAIVQITPDKLPKLGAAPKRILAQTQVPAATHAVFTADSSKPGAEKATITPLPPKAPAAPTKKSTVLFQQNGRA